MLSNAFAIVLAGGKGERFWPLSTAARPKQMLSLIGGEPLVASAVGRLKKLMPEDHVFVITSDDLVASMRVVLPSLPMENIVGEPVGRDTAAAITLGAALIKAKDPNASFCVLTADHVMGDVDVFLDTLKDALLKSVSSVLITIGIKPSFASTGFGYIEAGDSVPGDEKTEFFKVKRFVEKPNISAAKRYVSSGSFFWNSGMFIWSVKSYESALNAHCPVLADMLNRLESAAGGPLFTETILSVYERLEKISIDYALMEKVDNIIMAKGRFMWDDVGAWTALENHIEKDASGNVSVGTVNSVDSSGNIVVAGDGMIALCGVKDMVVVRTDKTTLICPKDRAQDVKKLVELIKANKSQADFL